LSNYLDWLIKEQNNRLERFKQLQAEIILLEKQEEYFYDDERPFKWNKKKRSNDLLSKKISKVIEELEWEESNKRISKIDL